LSRWPLLDEPFDDEFGAIAPDVYAAAAHIWPRAENFASRVLGDGAEGVTLMMRAVADVCRYRARGHVITHLSGYLYRTFCRLTMAEKERLDHHKRLEEANHDRLPSGLSPDSSKVDETILVDQLRQRMDPWTREVFDLRWLGHTFDEIGEMKGVRPATVRDRLHDNLKKLGGELERGDE
jgi:DNA-directed RNA polymerase specialized sigma24 family protein